MKNLAKPIAIVIFLTLALVGTIFGVQRGIRYFLKAEVEPTPIPTPTLAPFAPLATPTPAPIYTLQDFQEFLNAMGTSSTKWDLNKDGIVNETDLNIFKTHYQP